MQTLRTFLYTHKLHLLMMMCVIGFFVADVSFVQSGVLDDEAGTESAAEIDLTVAGFLHSISLAIGTIFMYIGGSLLQNTVNYTILNMGSYFASSDNTIGGAVTQVWSVIRDIFNILFIFGFIWIGLKTILNSEQSETRRTLGLLIVAALLINFSLYVTSVIIDFTNIAAIQIHNQITAQGIGGVNMLGVTVGEGTIPAGIVNSISIGNILAQELPENDGWAIFTYSIFTLFFLVITGIILGYLAILLITRFVALIIYMVLSPAMFLGWIFPGFAKYQSKWWGGFLQQAFFAPASFFMLYLALLMIGRMKLSLFGANSTPEYDTVMTSQATGGTFQVIVFFCISMGFVYASILVGKKMGVAGADMALKGTQKVIGGATVGLAARAARNTAGRYSNAAAESDRMKDWASKSAVGRGFMHGLRGVADNNMDLRSAGVGGGTLGTARKGGFKTAQKEHIDNLTKFSASLGEINDDDPEVKALKEHEHHLQDDLLLYEEAKKEAIKDYRAEVKAKEIVINGDASLTDEQKKAKIAEAKKSAKETHLDPASKALNDHKKAIKEAGENVAHEKNRRVVGTVAYKEAVKKLEDAQKARKKLEDELVKAVETQDLIAVGRIRDEMKQRDDGMKALNEAVTKEARGGGSGYAGSLTNSWAAQSWVVGASATHDRAAGKSIREKYSKKSMKDDASHSKKDDYKKDDHGGGDHAPKPSAPAPAGGSGGHDH